MNPVSNPPGPQPSRRHALRRLGALALAPAAAPWARASDSPAKPYPTKPVRILIGYAPGGSADVSARIAAEALQNALGQSVVVENLPGASGSIAARTAARAAPDGHTLLLGNTNEVSIFQYLNKNPGYDPLTDLVPVAPVYNLTHAIAVTAKSPHQSLNDLLSHAQAHPDAVTFASAGIGSVGHLAGETLALSTQTKLTHVPYKGGGQVLADLLGGQLTCHFGAISTVMPHMRSGALRLLAVTSQQRVQAAPDIPTVSEVAKIEDFDFPLWGGIFVPASTPRDIVTRLNTALNQAYRRPDVQNRISALYSDIWSATPEEFARFLAADARRYERAIKESRILPQ